MSLRAASGGGGGSGSNNGAPALTSALVDSTSSGSLNNYSGPGGSGFGPTIGRLVFVNTVTLTGINASGYVDGDMLQVIARAGATVTTVTLSGSSSAANQFGGPISGGYIESGTGGWFIRDNSLWLPT